MRTIAFCFLMSLTLAATGCFVVLEENTLDESWTFDEPVSRVEVDLDVAGLTIVGVDCEGAKVDLEAELMGPTPEYEVVLEGETLVIRRLPDHLMPTWVRGGFFVQVPHDVALDLEMDTGAIELEDIDGDIDASTDTGAIRGRGLLGEAFFVETDTGAIELELEGTVLEVDARADTGAIEITVPEGNYDISTSTDVGSVEISGLCHDEGAEGSIHAQTDTGAIRLMGR